MKKIISAALSCVPLYLAAFSSSVQADISELLSCSSDLIYQRQGSPEVLADIAGFIKNAIQEPGNVSDLSDSTSRCNDYKNMLKDSSPTEESVYLDQISSLNTSPEIKQVFTDFAKPKNNCNLFGGYGNLTVLHWSITGGCDLAYCNSTLGKRWLEVRPYTERGTGFGTYVGGGVNYGWDSDTRYTSSPISLTPRASMEVAALVSGKLASRGKLANRDQMIPNTIGVGFGAGAKGVVNLGLQLNVTALPLPSNFQPVINKLNEQSEQN